MATITKTIGTSSRDYSTIQAWADDLNNGGIYSSGDVAQGVIYNDSVFDESISITLGSAVGLSAIILTVNEADRHDGTAGSGARVVASTPIRFFVNNSVNTTIEWLEVDHNGQLIASASNSILGSGTHTLRNCIIHDNGDDGQNKRFLLLNGVNCSIYNNIFYNLSGNGTGNEFIRETGSSGKTVRIYNNTGYNSIDVGIDCDTNQSGIKVYNNIMMNCGNNCFEGAASQDRGYNLSSDATAPGTGSVINKTAANQFVSITGGSEDLHLKAGSDAIGAGTDLSAFFTTDIDNETRITWDIGADWIESVVASGHASKVLNAVQGFLKMRIQPDSTSNLIKILVLDENGDPLTTADNTSLTLGYLRDGASSVTSISLSDGTVGTYSSGSVKHVANGVYELSLPNAAVASGVKKCLVVGTDTNGQVIPVTIELDANILDSYAEIGQGTPAATNTPLNMIRYLFKAWRNKKTQTSSTYSLYADDATTVDQKSTVSDDGTTTTIGEIATGP